MHTHVHIHIHGEEKVCLLVWMINIFSRLIYVHPKVHTYTCIYVRIYTYTDISTKKGVALSEGVQHTLSR